MKNKGIISTILCLSIMTSSLSLTGCGKKEDGYVLEMHDDSLVVHEATDIHSSDIDKGHKTVFTLKNGEEYSLDDSICIVTKSKEEVDNYYNMFNNHQSTIQNARYADEKEETCFVMEIIDNNLIVYEAKTFYFNTTKIYNDKIIIKLKNGERRKLDDKKCLVTENREVAENYFKMFDEWENTNAVWIKVDQKEKTR